MTTALSLKKYVLRVCSASQFFMLECTLNMQSSLIILCLDMTLCTSSKRIETSLGSHTRVSSSSTALRTLSSSSCTIQLLPCPMVARRARHRAALIYSSLKWFRSAQARAPNIYSSLKHALSAQARALNEVAVRCQRQAAVRRAHYVCLSCERRGRKTAARLCSETFRIVCQNCQDSPDFIPAIDMVGRVVTVQGRQLYLAPCCGTVQEYTGTGQEFSGACQHAGCRRQGGGGKKKPKHKCAAWNCQAQAMPRPHRVVDHLEGCMEEVFLCHKHTPPEEWLKKVKNFKQFSATCYAWEKKCRAGQKHKAA